MEDIRMVILKLLPLQTSQKGDLEGLSFLSPSGELERGFYFSYSR